MDAVDATRLAERAKLEHGRVVFLDVEAGAGSLTAPARAYIKAWVSAMQKASSYRPGIYCSFKTNAAVLHQDNPDAVFWVWNLGHVDDPLPGGKPVRLHPSRSGVAFATAWQLFQSEIHEKGWTLTLDINGQRQKLQHWDFDTATSPDPSQPGADVPPWPGHGVVHPGASNDFVKLMQRKLIARGFAIPAGPTGFYGPQTKDAVTRYQQPRPRLHPADGVVGPRTWDQLFRGR